MYRIANGLKVPGKKVELINLGTPAQPPSYQLKWLRQVGYRYQPDLLIQTVYGEIAGIDTDDTIPDNGPCVKDGYLYPAPNMTFAAG